MKHLSDTIKELIPPNDYEHRNGFSNEHLIDQLSKADKTAVETELLKMLESADDLLIGQTLAYLHSSKAIPLMESKLKKADDAVSRIHWAGWVDNLKEGEQDMKDVAFEEFKKLSDIYQLISAFPILVTFKDPRINERIKSYLDDPAYLVAYNARTALGEPVDQLIKKG